MKILVAGGAGYIGSHVVRELLDRSDDVTVFDNLSSGCRENCFDEAAFIEGDIRDERQIREAFQRGFDAFIHLAAYKAAGESMLQPQKYAVNNIGGTINLLNAAVESGTKLAVFSSSAAVYGRPAYAPIDEMHPTEPENFYGFTKLEIERLLRWYGMLKGLRYAALRYFNAAGYDLAGRIRGLERNPANLLPVVMETAAGMRPRVEIFGADYDTPDGTGIRDYVHVSDLARGHALALDRLDRYGESFIVNLGSETGVSVLTMIEKAREITGRPIPAVIGPRREGDTAKLFASSEKARDLLGWKATASDVETLLASTWKVYQTRTERAAVDRNI